VMLGSGSILNIGTGELSLSDFVFNTTTGFGQGTYVLIDTTGVSSIVGSLSSTDLTGVVGGLTATLSLSTDTNGYQEIILSVVPEPHQTWLLGFALLSLVLVHNRRVRLIFNN